MKRRSRSLNFEADVARDAEVFTKEVQDLRDDNARPMNTCIRAGLTIARLRLCDGSRAYRMSRLESLLWKSEERTVDYTMDTEAITASSGEESSCE